ncbi:MAG TPA: hypothetical protein VFS67_30630 [Polyangiaceae bacterium]|jgi:hypothetical protein|nr:hypothetical protein [Polyangiaceae bacterium]
MTAGALQDLASELKVLHKALLSEGRRAFEAEHGPVGGALHLLHLLVHEPAFAWLRPLSELMADLDSLLALESSPNSDEQGDLRAELEELLSPANSGLWAALTAFIQSAPDVAGAYARVRQILASLPKPAAKSKTAGP